MTTATVKTVTTPLRVCVSSIPHVCSCTVADRQSGAEAVFQAVRRTSLYDEARKDG